MRRKIAYVCLALLLVAGIAGKAGYDLHQRALRRASYDILLAQYNQHCGDLIAMFTTTQAKHLIQDAAAHGEHGAQLGVSYAAASTDQRTEIAKQFVGEIKAELDEFHELSGLMRPHVVAANEAAGGLRKLDLQRFNVNRLSMARRLKDALNPLSELDGTFGPAAAIVEIKTRALTNFKAQHNGSAQGFDDDAEMLKAATAVLEATATPHPQPK